jgi:cytochrome c oxidase subunit IV
MDWTLTMWQAAIYAILVAPLLVFNVVVAVASEEVSIAATAQLRDDLFAVASEAVDLCVLR